MAVTTTYNLTSVKSEFISAYPQAPSPLATNEFNPSIVALADGGYAIAYSINVAGNAAMAVERYNADGTLRPSSAFAGVSFVASEGAGNNIDPAITQLANGNILVTWTRASGTDSGIHYAIVNVADGTIPTGDTLLPGTDPTYFASDVKALPGGGFVVVAQINSSASDQDAKITFFDSANNLVSSTKFDNFSVFDQRHPSVTVLINGNVVVAYEQELVNNSGTFGQQFEIYSPGGTRIGNPVLFDSAGTQNLNPDILALSDGGFAVAYEDNGLGLSVAFFNADGTSRGASVSVNPNVLVDKEVSITQLANGYLQMTWTNDNADILSALINPATLSLLSTGIIENQSGIQDQSSVTTLTNGNIVTTWTDANNAIEDGNTDPNGKHVSMEIDAYTRTSVGDSASNLIVGDSFVDFMFGNGGLDTLRGFGGDDTLDGGAGGDFLDGGNGRDTANYTSSASGVSVNLQTGAGGGGDAAGDALLSIENVTGSNFGDVLTGDAIANVLHGLAGNDVLVGGLGQDTLDGGADLDTVDYSAYVNGVSINLGTGAGADGDLLISIENAIGSAFGDVLTGDNGANTMRGGAGNDFLVAGNGADFLDGGADLDTVSYATATGGVLVNLGTGAGANGGVLANIENILGSNFGDVLFGDNGANTINGGAGNDFIVAGNGADNMIGGADNDTVSYETATLGIAANLTTGAGANGGVLNGIENLTGSNFGDVLTGDGGSNTIKGGAGNDFIVGGAGSDALFGGADADIFRYAAAGYGGDVIVDFQDGVDKLSFATTLATSFSNFTIAGNGTNAVTLSLAGQAISVQGAAAITLDAGDFLFVA